MQLLPKENFKQGVQVLATQMALTSTILRFNVELADVDRGVYETLAFRVAQHPSEDNERVSVRVLAKLLAHHEHLEFGRGLSEPDDPPLHISDLSGRLLTWIEIGAPSAERLHRASKKADTTIVYTHKPISGLAREWAKAKIHESDQIEFVHFGASELRSVAECIAKQNEWVCLISDGLVQLTIGETPLQIEPRRVKGLDAFLALS